MLFKNYITTCENCSFRLFDATAPEQLTRGQFSILSLYWKIRNLEEKYRDKPDSDVIVAWDE